MNALFSRYRGLLCQTENTQKYSLTAKQGIHWSYSCLQHKQKAMIWVMVILRKQYQIAYNVTQCTLPLYTLHMLFLVNGLIAVFVDTMNNASGNY